MSRNISSFDCADFQLSGSDYTLRYLSVGDLQLIASIELRAHPFPWPLKHFQSSLESHHCIGLQHDGEWIGYAILSFVVGEAELLLFVIDKPWRGRGLASAFLQNILEAIKTKVQSIFLEVRASNEKAIHLYESVGFNEVGLRPGYYPKSSGKQEDAVLMALMLGDELFSPG